MTKRSRKNCILTTFALLLAAFVARQANAQTPTPAGDLLCSAGPRDGVACTVDEDCFGSCRSFGACVLVQGVCDGGANFDGFPCDCPGGNCVSGTCSGGVFAGSTCTAQAGSGTCESGIRCVASQKVCLAGTEKGFSCLNNGQCPASSCASTGKFCDAGDFQDYSCVDSADCVSTNSGTCVPAEPADCGSPTATPTKTPTPRSPTPTRTVKTPGTVTVTPTTSVSSATPTNTRSPAKTLSPTASPTVAPNTAVVAEFAAQGAPRLIVLDGAKLPTSGTIASVNGEPILCTNFNRGAGSNTLVLASGGLPRDVPAGAVIAVGRDCTLQYVNQGCTIAASGDCRGLLVLAGGMLLGLVLRRRHAQ